MLAKKILIRQLSTPNSILDQMSYKTIKLFPVAGINDARKVRKLK